MMFNSFQVQTNHISADASTANTIVQQVMTVDDLASTPTREEMLAQKKQKFATGRRSHKTIRGGREAVWPPSLEAALIKGLQTYSERYKVFMKRRGRFIGRNHFLSHYVESATGRRRSPKQVGSRLQQLKATCRELEILYLITGSRSLPQCRNSRRRKSTPSKSPHRSPTPDDQIDVESEDSSSPAPVDLPQDQEVQHSFTAVSPAFNSTPIQDRLNYDYQPTQSPTLCYPQTDGYLSNESFPANQQQTLQYDWYNQASVQCNNPIQMQPQYWDGYQCHYNQQECQQEWPQFIHYCPQSQYYY